MLRQFLLPYLRTWLPEILAIDCMRQLQTSAKAPGDLRNLWERSEVAEIVRRWLQRALVTDCEDLREFRSETCSELPRRWPPTVRSRVL